MVLSFGVLPNIDPYYDSCQGEYKEWEILLHDAEEKYKTGQITEGKKNDLFYIGSSVTYRWTSEVRHLLGPMRVGFSVCAH